MNSQQAKEILLRYRPGTTDQDDPEVRAALKLATVDPGLAVWLEDHRRFQEKLKTEHREMPIPEGLREQILSEIPGRFDSLRSRRRRFAMALMAGMFLLFSLVIYTVKSGVDEDRFATFRLRMVKASLRGYAMDIETASATELRTFLENRQAQSGWESPPGLGRWPLLGGAVMKWQNQPVTMICFGRNKQPERWLFIANSSSMPDPPPDSNGVFKKVNRLNTVSWSRNGLTYILAGDSTDKDLEKLLNERG
jgi:hypothetical protein